MNKKEILLIAIIVLMFVAGLYFYPQLPDQVPTHWDADGKINGYSPKSVGLFLMPAISLAVYLLLLIIPKIEVYKKNIEAFSGHLFTLKLALILFFFVLNSITIIQSKGYIFNMNYVILPLCAVLFYYIGHMLKYVKRNFFIGIRTPWTLSNENVWNKTHAIGSKLFKIIAIIILIGLFFGKYAVWVILIPLLVGVLFLVVYSYVLYQKENKETKKQKIIK